MFTFLVVAGLPLLGSRGADSLALFLFFLEGSVHTVLTYNKQLVTGPTEPVVRLDQCLKQLRLEGLTDEAELDDIVDFEAAVTRYVEKRCGRAFCTQEWDVWLPAFPGRCSIPLPLGRLQSVDEFEYTLADGSVVEWLPDETTGDLEYAGSVVAHVNTHSDYGGSLDLPFGLSWPAVTLKTSDPIRARVTVGYGAASAVPSELKMAIRLMLHHLYDHRHAVVMGDNVTIESREVQLSFESLISEYIIR